MASDASPKGALVGGAGFGITLEGMTAKSEARNPKQFQITKIQMTKNTVLRYFRFCHLKIQI